MKLKIEKWIEETRGLSKDAESLMKEAILCYKVSAYRASFILSYLAFKTTLKDRILYASRKPQNIIDKNWNYIIKNLKNDENWEFALNPVIHQIKERDKEKDFNIFQISDSLRRECSVWKEKRNICAHAKNNIINNSTTEIFWIFMEDNLSKFEVAGGKEYLIDEVKRAFLFRNEEGQEKDYNKFIISIAQLYEEDEVKIFFSKIYEWISDEYKFAYLDELNGSKEFWKCFICSDDLIVQKGIIQFIKSDIYVFINFYRLYHDIFYKIVSDNEFKKITLANWLTENWTVFENTNIYWDILCEILNYIPEDDIKDFNKKIVGKRNLWSLPPDDKESFLKDKGYFEACKEYLFEYNEVLGRERDGFDFIQSSNNVDFWIECLKNIDINNNVVRKSMDVIKMIIRKYDNGSYFFCNSAYRKLEKFFKAEKTIFNEFIDNCNEMEISAKEFKENFI